MSGKELKRLLLWNGIGISDLASKMAMTQQALSNRLTAKNVKPDFIEKIEDALGFKIEKPASPNAETQQLIELLKKKDEQIDRLISLFEDMQKRTSENEKRRAG